MYRALTLLVAATLSGQWINEPARGVPRTRDDKPSLTAPTPRMGGKPDFRGLWQADTAPPGEAEKIIPGRGSEGMGAAPNPHGWAKAPREPQPRLGRLLSGVISSEAVI
jgi:hypothetical protein